MRISDWSSDVCSSDLFREVGQAMLGEAQKAFLERAEARFKQSEESAGQNLKALLSPVHERLEKYEQAVAKVEAKRRDAFGMLHGQIAALGLEDRKSTRLNSSH